MSLRSFLSSKSLKTNSGKVTKVIGSENPDDLAKNIISGEIVLSPNEYANFWNEMKNKTTCSRYLARIMTLLINIEKDPSKVERSLTSKKFGNMECFTAILLNTVQFIDMFMGFDPNQEAFLAAMTKFKQEKASNPKWNNEIYQVLNFLDRKRGQKEGAAKKMVVDCSTLESDEEMKRIGVTPSSNMTGDVCYGDIAFEGSYLEFPFTYTVLTKMSRTEVSESIFDEVLNILEQAGNTLSSMAGMQGRTLALMFMLREFLTISPTNDQVWLHRACEVLIGMYKWPTPYGILAKEVLDFVSLERRSPGCHLRDRILSENPELQPVVLQRLHATDLHAQEISPNNLAKRCSTVALFVDSSQPLCCLHKTLLFTGDRPRSDTLDSNVTAKHASTSTGPLISEDRSASLMRDILLHIIELDFYLRDRPARGHQSPPEDPLGLSQRDQKLIIGWYVRALNIVEKAKSLPATTLGRTQKSSNKEEKLLACAIPGGLAKLYRESMLGELLQEISPGNRFPPRRSQDTLVTRSPRRPISRPSSLAFPLPIDEIHAQTRLTEVHRALSSDSDNPHNEQDNDHPPPSDQLKEPLPFGVYAPGVPDMTFQLYEVGCLLGGFSPDDFVSSSDRLDTMTVANNYNTLRNEVGYVQFVQDTNDLLKMFSQALREKQEFHGDHELQLQSNESKGPDSPPEKCIVKVVLMGSNTVLHRFLCAYVVLLSQHPDIVQGVQMEIFLTPVGKNKLGTFLARSDKWYRRHIYDSFKGPLGICPQYPSDIEVAESVIRESEMAGAPPVRNLKKLLEDYVRQASNAYPVCVFEVLCWAAFEERLSMDSNSTSPTAAEDIFTQQQSSPDIVIPFMMQIDIGLRTQVEQYRLAPLQHQHQQSNGQAMRAHFDSQRSVKDILSDQEFHMAAVDLTVSYVPSSMSSAEIAQERGEVSKSDSYTAMSFNNFPMTSSSRADDAAERNLLANAPHLNFLVMNSQPCKGALSDAFQSRRRSVNGRAVDTLVQALANPATYDPPQPISAARVDVSHPRDRFHILVDGCVYGPFRRIVIRSCQVGVESSEQSILSLPVMTFMPIATV